jgi:hypothetical protein
MQNVSQDLVWELVVHMNAGGRSLLTGTLDYGHLRLPSFGLSSCLMLRVTLPCTVQSTPSDLQGSEGRSPLKQGLERVTMHRVCMPTYPLLV